MGYQEEEWVQFSVTIPADLRRRAKLAAVGQDVKLREFVIAAFREKIARSRVALVVKTTHPGKHGKPGEAQPKSA